MLKYNAPFFLKSTQSNCVCAQSWAWHHSECLAYCVRFRWDLLFRQSLMRLWDNRVSYNIYDIIAIFCVKQGLQPQLAHRPGVFGFPFALTILNSCLRLRAAKKLIYIALLVIHNLKVTRVTFAEWIFCDVCVNKMFSRFRCSSTIFEVSSMLTRKFGDIWLRKILWSQIIIKNRLLKISLLLSAKSSLFGLIFIMDLILEYLFAECL